MPSSTTLTVRLSPEVKDSLAKLAAGTRRTNSFLAAEAIEAYVKRELPIVEAINRGLEDVRAGRVVPHDQVEAEISAIIEQAEARKRA